MKHKIHNSISKVCALTAATLVLPVLAYADHDSGKGNKADNDRKGDSDERGDRGDKQIPVVPEANAGWVLVPFFGAVLWFSSRRLFSANLAKK
jgi:hypothetical protein